jgi:signal transduction histidine kinase
LHPVNKTIAQGSESESSKRYHDLLALSRVSAAVSGLWDLDAILEVALDNVLSIMEGSIGGILLLDEDTKTLSYRVHRGLSEDYVRTMRLNLGEGIAGRVAESSKAVIVEDVSKEPFVAFPDVVKTEGLRAFISVPLRSKDSVLGVINVASQMPRRFGKDDLHLLHSIGDQVGVAVEQAKLYERLAKGRERYRQLARQTLMAQEEARRRLARELHDETSQSLSGLSLSLQALVEMAEIAGGHDEEFIQRLKKAHNLAVNIGVEVNRIIRELRPTLLDTLGLVPAIKQYAETSLGNVGIKVSLETKGSISCLPSEVEVGLFRFAQGAVGNIARHSQATTAAITLECRPEDLVLRITDDGQGFDVSRITGIEESGRGRGLFSMKERIALLGGSCKVKSKPGEGTTVTAMVPLVRRAVGAQD